uniref:FTH domain-containing protein n=1 Tax=Panagrellus redivivus TaxID=6233 RepID=A0A7E4W1Y8_PANRE
MVCNQPAFRGLKRFAIMNPTVPSINTWIEALVETGCTSLKQFDLYNTSLSILDIDKEVFLKFINAQCEGFKMEIEMRSAADFHSMEERFEAQFSEQFEVNFILNYFVPRKRVFIEYHGSPYLRAIYTLRADCRY